MSSREVKLYMSDIVTAIDRIMEYTSNTTKEGLEQDYKSIDAIVRNFEILGEAARNMPEGIKERYPEVQWSQMIAMRNKVAHEYFNVDVDQLWKTITEDLPVLKQQIEVANEQEGDVSEDSEEPAA